MSETERGTGRVQISVLAEMYHTGRVQINLLTTLNCLISLLSVAEIEHLNRKIGETIESLFARTF